ncbi:hypothetical protein EV421DRAFT_2032800 [Armillaria borealis]|uniref:Uncharacterized protein n=1 Tax=Armillaria borealis TaxID=47425 RepID=A0AA39MWP2_9AGAR|nr:hypothetical protein EV421DRAFT_2032800 [Armillaria borealis]
MECRLFSPNNIVMDIELVSKGWRSALLSCARAWSYIVIRDASLFDFGYSEVIRLGRQLQRAQNHPLSIFIHEPPGTSILSSHLIVCLIPFAHKIQTMHLSVSYNTIPRFCPIGPSLRSLHSLSITSNNTFVRSHLIVPDPFGDTFRDAGNLQYLELQDVYYARIALLSIPWRAITHLKIANQLKARFHHYTAPEDILEVLSIVTTIEDLELQISLVSPNPSGDSNPLTVPSLRSLKFLAPVNHFGNISSLLDRLDMPSLTQLVVECADALLLLVDVAQTLRRSHDIVRHAQSLHTTTNLEDLRLANVGNDTITDTILRELAVIDESPPAFPKLHTLHIDGAWGFKPANFIKTVRSRCTLSTGYAQLRSVRVAWKAGVFDDMEDRAHAVASQLKDCEADGLELSSFVFSLLVPLD